MNDDHDPRYLPVPYEDRKYLPVRITSVGPYHKRANGSLHPVWSTFASQLHIRDFALNTTADDIWLATSGGVLHWASDHRTFTRYASEHGLSGNNTKAIAVDGSGQVWAASEQSGLSYLDGDYWHPYVPLGKQEICCLSTDSGGDLWVSTTQSIYTITHPNEEPASEYFFKGASPRKLVIDDDHTIWLCNAQGIFYFEHGNWERLIVQPGILTLAVCHDQLWLGTTRGLALLKKGTDQLLRNAAWPTNEVAALAPSPSGVGMWAACGGYVGLATEAGWTIPLGERKQLSTRITKIALINDDEIWVGTHHGLFRGTHAGMHRHLTDAAPDVIGLPTSTDSQRHPVTLSNLIQAIAVQPRQEASLVWLGTPEGLFRLDTSIQSWERFGQRRMRDIRDIVINHDSPDTLWIASCGWTGGIMRAKVKHTFQRLSAELEMDGPMLVLSKGIGSTYWAAGFHGLYRRNRESPWICVLPNERLPQKGWIQAIVQVSSTQVWLGTSDGLLHYDPTTDTLLPNNSLLGNIDVRVLLLSPMLGLPDLLWIGTKSGLYTSLATQIKAVEQLTHYTITTLAWDDDSEKLWVGTDRGLFCVTQQDNGVWVIEQEFTSETSGLAANRITALAHSRNLQQKQELWIGTPCGLNCFTY